MRKFMLVTAACGAALVAGCTDSSNADERTTVSVNGVLFSETNGKGEVRVADRLACPEREGDLRLISAATNGRTCAYRGNGGEEVELRLASAGDLGPLETELQALIPGAEAPPEPPMPPLPPEPIGGEAERVRIPGLLDVRSEGDRASVRLPGMTVEAQGENADVRMGGKNGDIMRVRAHEGGATVRISEPEAAGDRRSIFLVTSEEPGPAGWRVAGYQARGSAQGPVVVGVIRAHREGRGDLMSDVEKLLDRNVRG